MKTHVACKKSWGEGRDLRDRNKNGASSWRTWEEPKNKDRTRTILVKPEEFGNKV